MTAHAVYTTQELSDLRAVCAHYLAATQWVEREKGTSEYLEEMRRHRKLCRQIVDTKLSVE